MSEIDCKTAAHDVTRRGFVGGAVGVAAAAAAWSAVGASDAHADEGAQGSAAEGAPAYSDEELDAMLHAESEVTEDYTLPDGTVVPAVYLRLRNRINRIGLGVGSQATEHSFAWLMATFSEDDALHYCEMPLFDWFSANDYHALSGRPEQECLDICEDLADRCLLNRTRRGGVAYFHLLTLAHGLFEFTWPAYSETYVPAIFAMRGPDHNNWNAGTPMYHAVPVSRDVIAEEEILPYDDYEAVIARNSVIALSPCQCRLARECIGTLSCDHPRETCISTGETAEFYIENGIGRQITQDEAREVLQRSVDEGMVIQHVFTKTTEVICSCHSDCCLLLSAARALNGEGDAMANASNYNLEVDLDACVGCGACVERCPMKAVSMGEDGRPVVDAACVRCGQCGLTCPVAARTLVARDPADQLDLPVDMAEDYLVKARNRMTKGYIVDFVG